MIFYFPLQLNNVSFFGFVFPLVHSSVFTLSSFSSPIHFLSPFLFSLSSSSRPISYVEAHPLPSFFFFFLSSSTLANPSPLPLAIDHTHQICSATNPLKLCAQSRRTAKWHRDQRRWNFWVCGFWLAGFMGFRSLFFFFFCWFFGSSSHGSGEARVVLNRQLLH